jgi:N-acetylglucosaminyldiphosphoundecaprenol N-acetyl-beta-D-mannosaminyltransferase
VVTRPRHPQVRLMGIALDNLDAREALDRISADLAQGRGGWGITPNLDIVRRMVVDPAYRELLSPATLRLADGMPLVWASRVQRTPLKERVAGSDLIWTLSARAAHEGRSVYFLGGNPGAAQTAAAKLKELHPSLIVAGIDCPPIGFEHDEAYMAGLRERLLATAPDICFVALGAPKQDRVIRALFPLLPRTWFLGIGISFSFVAGEVKRAPRWMRASGLEWVHRMAQEPRRLAKRYLLEGVPFAARLFASALLARFRGVPEPGEQEGEPRLTPTVREPAELGAPAAGTSEAG